MNLGLYRREHLHSGNPDLIGAAAVEQFQRTHGAITAWQEVEHDGDGHHTAIHADSLTVGTGTGFVRATDGVYTAAPLKRVVGGVIGDGSTVIALGVAGFVSCPVAGRITKVRLLSSDPAVTVGSIVIDVWKDTFGNYPPTVADTITAAAKPTITSATKSEDATLAGWTTAVQAGDVFGFVVISVTALKRVTVELTVDE